MNTIRMSRNTVLAILCWAAMIAIAAFAGGPFRADAATHPHHPRKVTPKVERVHPHGLISRFGAPFRTR
jgi:hypothetical protein